MLKVTKPNDSPRLPTKKGELYGDARVVSASRLAWSGYLCLSQTTQLSIVYIDFCPRIWIYQVWSTLICRMFLFFWLFLVGLKIPFPKKMMDNKSYMFHTTNQCTPSSQKNATASGSARAPQGLRVHSIIACREQPIKWWCVSWAIIWR